MRFKLPPQVDPIEEWIEEYGDIAGPICGNKIQGSVTIVCDVDKLYDFSKYEIDYSFIITSSYRLTSLVGCPKKCKTLKLSFLHNIDSLIDIKDCECETLVLSGCGKLTNLEYLPKCKNIYIDRCENIRLSNADIYKYRRLYTNFGVNTKSSIDYRNREMLSLKITDEIIITLGNLKDK